MTRHKIGKVTRNTPYLIIVIFSDEVVKVICLLLCLDRYLFIVVSGNRYLPRGSKENALSNTITGNVTISIEVVLVVAIPFLDFVMIHCIH